jgi:hypothetical protein
MQGYLVQDYITPGALLRREEDLSIPRGGGQKRE